MVQAMAGRSGLSATAPSHQTAPSFCVTLSPVEMILPSTQTAMWGRAHLVSDTTILARRWVRLRTPYTSSTQTQHPELMLCLAYTVQMVWAAPAKPGLAVKTTILFSPPAQAGSKECAYRDRAAISGLDRLWRSPHSICRE